MSDTGQKIVNIKNCVETKLKFYKIVFDIFKQSCKRLHQSNNFKNKFNCFTILKINNLKLHFAYKK